MIMAKRKRQMAQLDTLTQARLEILIDALGVNASEVMRRGISILYAAHAIATGQAKDRDFDPRKVMGKEVDDEA